MRATDDDSTGSIRSAIPGPSTRVRRTRSDPDVERVGSIQRLLAADAPIVSVEAPAGYGKTTTIASWDRADARPFAWVRIDRRDRDPHHLVDHLMAAVRASSAAGHLERFEETAGADDALERLTTILHASGPTVLVLDGMDDVLPPEAAGVISDLLTQVEAGTQIVLVGRSVGPIPLAARRLAGEVVDIRTADLVLSDEAARQLIRPAALPPATIDAVLHRAEGWPAGLLLLARNGGSDAAVRSYLDEEVLAPLPEALRRFVESTSVLDRVTGETADELLGSSTSARMIEDLVRAGTGLLVAETDASYRYHRLFASLLQERSRKRDPVEKTRLRRRASELCERRGDLPGAVRHAMIAGDGERAADIVLERAFTLVFSGEGDELQRLLELLGADAPERWPAAAVATGWFGIGRGDATIVARALHALTPIPDVGPLADGSLSVAAAIAMMRSMVAPNGVSGVVVDAEAVRQAGDRDHNPFWGLATGIQGTAYYQLGEDDLARDRFADAYPRISHLPMFAAGVNSYLAALDLRAGDPTTGAKRSTAALAIAERHHLEELAPAVPIYAVAAMLAARTHHRDQARSAAAIATRLLERLGPLSARSSLFAHSCLGDAALHLDDRVGARDHLHHAVAARRRDPSGTRLNRDLDALLQQLRQRTNLGPADARLTPAEMNVLAQLPSQLSLAEIAQKLYISHNTAKSHSVAIYRKLAVSKRRDAVEAAQQLGLLPLPNITPS